MQIVACLYIPFFIEYNGNSKNISPPSRTILMICRHRTQQRFCRRNISSTTTSRASLASLWTWGRSAAIVNSSLDITSLFHRRSDRTTLEPSYCACSHRNHSISQGMGVMCFRSIQYWLSLLCAQSLWWYIYVYHYIGNRRMTQESENIYFHCGPAAEITRGCN